MSDRHMRLKYLTKMKIILCIFLLCNTAVSVFGQLVELNGILGESVKFPAAVKKEGTLTHRGVPIGIVSNGSFTSAKHNGRLQWDRSTGLFSLSELEMEDSGVYTVQKNDEPRSVSTFNLTLRAVSVFGIEGKSIEFPAAVKTSGNLIYSGELGVIGDVTNGKITTPSNKKYEHRVHWHSSTGYFSLSGLRLNDSGVYTVRKTYGKTSVSTFNLTVWVPVLKPNVSITRNEYPCTIECTAERGTEVTLSWYREGQKEPYVSSRVASAPHLHLPKTVERSGTYTCEAKNSVSNEKASITVGAHCAGSSAGTIAAIIIAVVAVAIVALIAVVFVFLYRRNIRKHLIIDGVERELQDCTFDPKEQTISTPASRGLSKGKHELGREEGDPPPPTDM